MSEEKKANFKIWWDEEKQVARSEMLSSELTTTDAVQMRAQSIELLETHKDADWLVDIVRAKDYPSPEVRVALTDMARHTLSGKMAFIVASKVMEKTASFMMKLIGKERNTKFFVSQDEALAWLKE